MATTVYSRQFVASAGSFPAGAPVDLFVATNAFRFVVRDITGGFVFGSTSDALTVSLDVGGSGSLTPLVTWDHSTPEPLTRELRVVMADGDHLVYQVTGSGSPALGGLVISGYFLTLP